MNVVIRADASIHIGSGHIMRCLVLADELKKQGHTVQFVMRPQQGDLFDFVKSRGFDALALPQVPTLEPKSTADYAAWLQVPITKEVSDFLALVQKIDLIIVDHYGITAVWEAKMIEEYDCKLVVIDDLVRVHNADLIIDQTLGRKASEYKASHTNTVLCGTTYALLNKQFARVREQYSSCLSGANSAIMSDYKILLTMGGIDKPNATLKVLKALKGNLASKVTVTVLLSPKAVNYDEVSAYCDQESQWVNHLDFVNDMAGLMQEHTLAIGAAGSTSWERACLGIPSIVVPLADNQRAICHSLVERGLALSVTLNEIDKLLFTTFHRLIKNYADMRERNLSACDGKGCERVIGHITDLMGAIN